MIPTSSIKNFKLFGKDERQKVSESVMPAIKQAKSAANLVQVLPNTLKCPCVSIKRALKKRGDKNAETPDFSGVSGECIYFGRNRQI